jgi:urease accessory protein
MRRITSAVAAFNIFLLASILAAPAHAHHIMGGELPSTFVEGLLSGLGHPVIGLDHLAFIVAVGIAAAFVNRGIILPIIFIAATIAGVAIHLQAIDIPFAELIIAISVLLAGTLILSGNQISTGIWATLFGLAGIVHGYAYGESIVGAEESVLTAYLLGFAVIQLVISLTAMVLTRKASDNELWAAASPRIAGGIVAGIGLVIVASHILPG